MDRLSQRDRQAFQTAAVIGQRFDLALLRRLIGAPDYVCEDKLALFKEFSRDELDRGRAGDHRGLSRIAG